VALYDVHRSTVTIQDDEWRVGEGTVMSVLNTASTFPWESRDIIFLTYV
jgi:hypothetical protein